MPLDNAHLLIIDECLPSRIATELNNRAKRAIRSRELSERGTKDPELLPQLAALHPDAVLVTYDDAMPSDHLEVLQKTGMTLAIVSPVIEPGYLPKEWQHNVIHQWAHKMEAQEKGTIKRYGLAGGRSWRARRKPTPRPQIQ